MQFDIKTHVDLINSLYCSVTTLQQVVIFFIEEWIHYKQSSLRCFISMVLKNWPITYDNRSVIDEFEMH